MLTAIIRTLVFTVLFLSTISGFGQIRGLELLENEKDVEFEFRFENNYILLDIRLNNFLPLTFIFDTGAEHTILFQKAIGDLLGFEYSQKVTIVGADLSEGITAYISRNISIDLVDLPQVKRDIVVLSEDYLRLEELTGTSVHGIIGSSFFHGMVIDINYKKRKIKLTHPDKFETPNPKEFKEVEIFLVNNKPYIKAKTQVESGKETDVLLLLDTGAGLTYLLHSNTDTLLNLPQTVMKGNLGHGLGGIIEGYVGKADFLEFGPFRFDNFITNFQDVDSVWHGNSELFRNGIIGNIILSRFRVIIDYTKHKLYLKAEKSYKEEFAYDKSGITLIAFGKNLDDYYVKDVLKDSPAALAGIQKGDLIKKVGFWHVSFLNLDKILKKFSGKHGDKITLKLKRGDECVKKTFYLKDFFLESPKSGRSPRGL